jgi:thiol-disulfide isomerase/thioredoxin
MKQFIILLITFAAFITAKAQKDTLPPYKQVPFIPAFTIQLTDSSNFSKKDLPKNTPVVIIYFNPECGHCQQEATELSKNMDKFKKVFFVMAAYAELEKVEEFSELYGLNKFSNVKLGRDGKYFLPVFYQVKTTPFSAVYNKKGKLLKAFEHGMSVEELEKALKD